MLAGATVVVVMLVVGRGVDGGCGTVGDRLGRFVGVLWVVGGGLWATRSFLWLL